MFRTSRISALPRVTALFGTAVLLFAACGSDSSTDSESGGGEQTSVEATISPETESTETSVAAGPVATKIISLSPSATEMLFAIGAGDQVIAVDDQSNFPAEAEAKKTDLSGFTPNLEAIAALKPDLVVHDGTTDLATQLDGLGIANWVGSAATSFDDIYVQIEQLGAATGHIAEAVELVSTMQTAIDAAVASVPKLDKPPRYYHELDNTLYSITSNTFIGEVYGLFDLQNIADTAEGGTDYPQLSAEFVISQSPDLIFLADGKCCGESPETASARPGWDAISAVSTGNVVMIDDDVASRWGPRVVDYVQTVATAMANVAAMSAG